MWSELMQRNPGLTIDNCASGGRRIDLEICSLSYPLWRSDLNDIGEGLKGESYWPRMALGDQVHVTGLALYEQAAERPRPVANATEAGTAVSDRGEEAAIAGIEKLGGRVSQHDGWLEIAWRMAVVGISHYRCLPRCPQLLRSK